MATTTTVSNVVREWKGDLQVNEGQLGQVVFDSPTADISLTPSDLDFDKLYSTYVVDASGAAGNINVDMPAVNTTSTISDGVAQRGWHCHIKNNGASNSLVIRENSGTNTIITLAPGQEVMLVANANAGLASDWVQLIDSTDLQEAYDASPDGQITIDSTRGAVTIRDASTPTGGNIFEVRESGGDLLLYVDTNKTFVGGDLVVNGSTTSIDSEVVNIADNHLYLNKGYTLSTAQTGGLVVNYRAVPSPNDASTTSTTGGFSSASTVEVADTAGGTAGFSVGDLIQISNTDNPDNEGIYEITALTAGAPGQLTISSPTNDFVNTLFAVDTTDTGAVITLVDISVIRAGTDGLWEVGQGNNGTIVFQDLGVGNPTLQEAYNNGSGSTEGLIKITAADDAVIVEASTGDPIESVFTVQSDTGTNNYFDIKNIAVGNNPALQALGGNASASGAIAIGDGSTASTDDAIAIGEGSTSSALRTTVVGRTASATGDNGTAIGNNADAAGSQSVAVGFGASSAGVNSASFGRTATASGFESTAIGGQTTASGFESTAVGNSSTADASGAIAFGSSATSSGSDSISIGTNTTVTGNAGALISTMGTYSHSTANNMRFGATSGFSYVTTTAANQQNELHDQAFLNVIVANATTPQTLYTLDASTANTAFGIYYHVLGLRNTTNSTAGSAGDSWEFDGYCKAKNVAGTVSFLEGDQVAIRDTPGTDVTFNVSGTDLQVQVTGLANHDIDWIINIRIQEHTLS